MSRKRRLLFAGAGLLALLSMTVLWLLRGGHLEQYLLGQLKQYSAATLGARLDIGALELNVFRGEIRLDNTVLHGREKPEEAPLLSARRLTVKVNWRLFLSPGLDLQSIEAVSPRFHLHYYPDGSSNLPRPPGARTSKGPITQLLALRLSKLELRDGLIVLQQSSIPLTLTAENIQLGADYLLASRSYRARLEQATLQLRSPKLPAEDARLRATITLDDQKLAIESARLEKGPLNSPSWVEGQGAIRHLEGDAAPPRAELDLRAQVATADANRYFSYPLESRGILRFEGQLLYDWERGLELHGRATGEDLYYRDVSTRLGPIRAQTQLDYIPSGLTLTSLNASAFGGGLTGAYRWNQQSGWNFDASLRGINLALLSAGTELGRLPWSALISGAVRASGGKAPLLTELDLEVKGQQGDAPLDGLLAITYTEEGSLLTARNSFLRLPHSELKFAGDLRSGLRFALDSSDLKEWEPLLRAAGWQQPEFPLRLQEGRIHATGSASGSLTQPRIQGSLSAQHLIAYGQALDSFSANLLYAKDLLRLNSFALARPGLQLEGSGSLSLDQGLPTARSILNGKLQARLQDFQILARDFAPTQSLEGAGELQANVQGSLEAPTLNGSLRSTAMRWNQESLDSLSAVFSATKQSLAVPEWEARISRHPVRGSFTLRANADDWKLGAGNAKFSTERLPLAALQNYRKLALDWDAQLSSNLDADFAWNPDGFSPSRLDGKLALLGITRYRRPVGQLEFTSRTSVNRAALTVQGAIRQQPVKGDANIRFSSRLETELRLQLPKLDFPTIAQLLSRERIEGPLPYEGGAEASIYLEGPLLDASRWEGTLTIPQLSLSPNKEYVQETLAQVSDVVLRNEGPIVLRYSKGTISARSTRFTAKDTNFSADFLYRLDNQTIGGRANGRINLAVLSTLQPDLLTTGVANLDAVLAGKLEDPRLNGKLSFENASFYLRDVITGLDKVNGTVLFDQNRATLESLQAQAGGGNLQLSGFVGFGKLLSYRLQAQAEQVRIRYPEGVSTTANANLALTGTTAQSILSGTVTIQRASVGQVDTAQILNTSSTAEAVSTSKNQFLQNLQFDVRVEAAQNAEFSTTLTKDVKGEIALRLRGTPQQPAVLGRVAVTQGEIDFFGNRYTISRGELRFENPLRIDPIVSLDLETRVRGVVINMTFSGHANKLNMNYRSDPPLQSREILALLTVGRNPSATSTSIVPTQGQNQGMFGNDSSVILGAAVSAGINGRLQRFFGISRVRLDPQLTGIDNVPQARLTLEQQVSRNVTLTYITNLNRTQQQIVRLDWDISRTWSVVAIRDENGVFGLDLFFRKRLK